jgi:site-specific recombinase XerD
MKFREVKTDYLNHIRYEAMLAKTTFQTYQAGLNRYDNWLAAEGYCEAEIDVALTTQVLRKYQYYLAGLKLRPRTMHGAFDPLQAVCKYLIKLDALVTDPCAKLTLPKRDEAQRLRMSDEEVRNLLEAAERQVSARDAAQSKAIIAVFCFTGVRAEECAGIQVSSIRFDFERPMFSVIGKGGKRRSIYMPDDCVGPLKAWLAERAKMNVHDYLWASSSKRYVCRKSSA